MITSPAVIFLADMFIPSGTKPTPAVFITICPFPSTTFVSPATILTPASFAVSAMDFTIFWSTCVSAPSWMINPQVRYLGVAPLMRRSLTVPHTHSLPISPPGNSIGVTTKLSVVMAILPLPSTTALSSISVSTLLSKALTNISSISSEVAAPPLPCAIVIIISKAFFLIFARFLHRLSIIANMS